MMLVAAIAGATEPEVPPESEPTALPATDILARLRTTASDSGCSLLWINFPFRIFSAT